MERDGTEIVPKDVQRYVNEKLVYFMEEICTFTVVEGLHRLIVSFFQLWLVCASTLLVYVTLYLYVCLFRCFLIMVIIIKAVLEMYADGELCELPTFFVCVVMRPGMDPDQLWRVSWALNGIGHNIVELSVYDWLAAIRRQRNEV